MNKKPNPIIAKLAQIMMRIEARIQHDYVSANRARFIAQTAFELTHHEDAFFTGDQIQKLVAIMVKYHESGDNQWHIDIEHSTAEHIAIAIGKDQRLKLPSSLFMAAVSPVTVANPAPLH